MHRRSRVVRLRTGGRERSSPIERWMEGNRRISFSGADTSQPCSRELTCPPPGPWEAEQPALHAHRTPSSIRHGGAVRTHRGRRLRCAAHGSGAVLCHCSPQHGSRAPQVPSRRGLRDSPYQPNLLSRAQPCPPPTRSCQPSMRTGHQPADRVDRVGCGAMPRRHPASALCYRWVGVRCCAAAGARAPRRRQPRDCSRRAVPTRG